MGRMRTRQAPNKIISLLLLALTFLVGILTADYQAFVAGSAPAGSYVTPLIAALLAAGVYGWYRIVKSAADEQSWKTAGANGHKR